VAQILEELRKDAVSVFRAGLEAASPENAVRNALSLKDRQLGIGAKRFGLDGLGGLILLGAGKASRGMALSIWRLLGDRVREGILSVPYGQGGVFETLQILEASHPVPDDRGLDNTKRIVERAENVPDRHLVVFLVSGGASSLLVAPPDGVTLKDLVQLNRHLLASGADIGEMNTVRRHVSRVKGGRLAEVTYPAPSVTLIISDVPGDVPSDVGSGPTVPDPTTYKDAQRVLSKYGLSNHVPGSILDHIQNGVDGRIHENPTEADTVFADSEYMIVARNSDSVRAACSRAEVLGYNSLCLPEPVTGDTKERAGEHVEIARQILRGDGPVDPPACIVSGGETTLEVRGSGKGGRNQEFCLHAAAEIPDLPIVVLSGDTDGADGSTDAAGAVSDGLTFKRAKAQKMAPASYLKNSNSYGFFDRLGDLLKTGPTGTNVMDLHIIMVGEGETSM
jgi:hydroxypyruvate reductase